jgi:hypothetical protein
MPSVESLQGVRTKIKLQYPEETTPVKSEISNPPLFVSQRVLHQKEISLSGCSLEREKTALKGFMPYRDIGVTQKLNSILLLTKNQQRKNANTTPPR